MYGDTTAFRLRARSMRTLSGCGRRWNRGRRSRASSAQFMERVTSLLANTEMIVPQISKIPVTPYVSHPMVGPVKQTSGSTPIRVDDSALIRQAQQGNTAAFEELVRQYDRAVLRLAIHLTGSPEDGQDIYQEAFLRAYINLARFRFECSFYTWIYRIVTNLCLDHLRKKRSRGRDLNTTLS